MIVGFAEYEINVAEAAASFVSRFAMVLAQFAVVVAAVPAVSTEVYRSNVNGAVTKVPAVPVIVIRRTTIVLVEDPAIQAISVADAAGGSASATAEYEDFLRMPVIKPTDGTVLT